MAKILDQRPKTIDRMLFQEANRYIPGGVNSPVRSFRAVGGYPVFVKKAKGSKFFGENRKTFIDYCLSWGALILGHAHPMVTKKVSQAVKNGTSFGAATTLETQLAKLITEAVPSIEKIRLTNSGTEAVMGAIRLARAYTGKRKIIKFAGSYHGHADYLLVKSGSGMGTLNLSDSRGVPQEFTKHTIVLPFNDIAKAEKAVKEHKSDLASIIVEPVLANCGIILPENGFLQILKRLANRYNIVLIFDEVITGFRLSYGGAQGYFNVKPDLTCLGKIIGGGLPIGAFGGKKQIMDLLAPLGEVYQAGTLSGNPIAVTAGIAALNILKKDMPYSALASKTKKIAEKIRLSARKFRLSLRVNQIASMFTVFFTDQEVTNYIAAKKQNSNLFKKFFHGLLREGIYFSPSGYETNFLSTQHSQEDIAKTEKTIDRVLKFLGR